MNSKKVLQPMSKGDAKLLSPQEIAGTWEGNGCCCSPECIRVEISPACCGGICVLQYCEGCPIPCVCQVRMTVDDPGLAQPPHAMHITHSSHSFEPTVDSS